MDLKAIPDDWQEVLGEEFEKPYFKRLRLFVKKEREQHTVYPPEESVFTALQTTGYSRTDVLILGQDPYHGEGQAHGLSFSVPHGTKLPPSLKNIFQELNNDLGCTISNNGCLIPWAKQGVLLLNAVLTVRNGEANSHQGTGWELFTDAVIRVLNRKKHPVIFVLWGNYAQKKRALVDSQHHHIITSAHPSPLSAYRGFFGSSPFSTINALLNSSGRKEIDWHIPDTSPDTSS